MELPRPSGGSAEFSLEGRFSLRHEERNYYGRISWRHADELDIILLSSSFGQGMAEMTVDEKGARLVLGDGRMREAPDAEALMSRVVGYPLSMKRLADWISGRGRSGGDDDVDRDAIGRLRRLRREGWIVDYAYDRDDERAPPSRIHAVRDDALVEFRLAIEDWREVSYLEDCASSKKMSRP